MKQESKDFVLMRLEKLKEVYDNFVNCEEYRELYTHNYPVIFKQKLTNLITAANQVNKLIEAVPWDAEDALKNIEGSSPLINPNWSHTQIESFIEKQTVAFLQEREEKLAFLKERNASVNEQFVTGNAIPTTEGMVIIDSGSHSSIVSLDKLDRFMASLGERADRSLTAHGLQGLYQRFIDTEKQAIENNPRCHVCGCSRFVYKAGLCEVHFEKMDSINHGI